MGCAVAAASVRSALAITGLILGVQDNDEWLVVLLLVRFCTQKVDGETLEDCGGIKRSKWKR